VVDTNTELQDDYTGLLTKVIKDMPPKVNVKVLLKNIQRHLDSIDDPSAYRKYLESALLSNLVTFFFETDDDGNIIKEASVMPTDTKNTPITKDLLIAAATAIDSGDQETARFLMQAVADFQEEGEITPEDEELVELKEEIEQSPYHRLTLIEEKSQDFGPGAGISWIRMTVDRANRDPNWVHYCRLHRAQHVGPLTWDFPILPHEDAQSVLRTIKEETGYSPRSYEQLDQRLTIERDLPGRPFINVYAETDE